jgi:hypothetical protein
MGFGAFLRLARNCFVQPVTAIAWSRSFWSWLWRRVVDKPSVGAGCREDIETFTALRLIAAAS